MTSFTPESPDEARWRQAALGGTRPRVYGDLVTTGSDGAPIEPLYLPRHLMGLERRGEPGTSPFVRAVGGPWVVAQRYEVDDVARLLESIHEDRAAGVDAAWLAFRGPLAGDRRQALADGLRGTGTPTYLEAGEDAATLAQSLAAAEVEAHALFDPLGELGLHGSLSLGWDAALASAGRLLEAARPSTRALAVSAARVHDAGGSAAQEIGFALACATEMVRCLASVGVKPEVTLGAMSIVVSPGPDVLAGVAKLRALRLGWAKLAVAFGVEVVPHLVGITSWRSQAALDVPTNMIRASAETAALILGHADVIATRPFDAVHGEPSRLGRRLAKNTQLVLREEAHLGAVGDPAGGSYFVEAHTDALARAGWDELRQIEAEGGAHAALVGGALAARVRAVRESADVAFASRRRVLVGVNNFVAATEAPSATPPRLGEGPLAPRRASEAFEAVRERAAAFVKQGDRPRALLLCLGDAREHRAREEFSRRFFEAGGFEVDRETGAGTAWVGEAVSRVNAPVVVVCGTDERYAELAVAAVAAAKGGGAAWVVLAGKPGALDAPLRAAGLDAAVHVGCDALASLGAALDAMEGAS